MLPALSPVPYGIILAMDPGVQKAWEELEALDPEAVSNNAAVAWADGAFRVQSLGQPFDIVPGERVIRAFSPGAGELLRRATFFFDHSWLWYLVRAQDFGLTGRQLRPEQLKGGHHFFRGAHELPLQKLAGHYGANRGGFLARAGVLGGRELSFGDASVELWPLPRTPVQTILWLGDDEFPPRADLLLDSSCELQLPLDVIWSVAMMSTMAMMP
jgi:hypothetical protein